MAWHQGAAQVQARESFLALTLTRSRTRIRTGTRTRTRTRTLTRTRTKCRRGRRSMVERAQRRVHRYSNAAIIQRHAQGRLERTAPRREMWL